MSTTIDDSISHSTPSRVLGEAVYDTATVTATPFTPTGTVTYDFYNTASPTYGVTTPVSTQTVNLSGGLVPNSTTTAGLTAGSYSFIGVYSGDSNYTGYTSSVETLTINQGSSSASTVIKDSTSGTPTNVLGEQVYDTAAVAGTPAAFTPTGTVTYYFYNTATPVYGTTTPVSTQTVNLSGGLAPNSATTSALTAGSYSFIAVYSGDTNYSDYTSSVETLTINQGSTSVSTAIFNTPSAGNLVVVDAAWAGDINGTPVVYGGNPYTFGTNAFATIQAGVNSAAAASVGTVGGTVLVVAGTYTEGIQVADTSGHLIDNITIQALRSGDAARWVPHPKPELSDVRPGRKRPQRGDDPAASILSAVRCTAATTTAFLCMRR